jgi:chromosome segregation ATPase|tara:strand:+ start:114 stop:593 length:480 start_codon:yes stop_codon:yes gene_type:complete
MIFGQLRMIMTMVIVAGLAGGVIYVNKLRSDNAILKANQLKLEASVESQKQVIAKQKEDFQAIMKANKELGVLINNLKKDLQDLDKRFTKKKRDIGKLAIERSKAIERIINSASDKAARCIEIASGSPLTEQEINATLKSQINTECPSIANPNYVPHNE